MLSRILALINKERINVTVRLIWTELNQKFTVDLSKVITEFSNFIYYFHYDEYILKHMYVSIKINEKQFSSFF